MGGVKPCLNLRGQRFSRLMVTKSAPRIGGRTAWFCDCDCGTKDHKVSTLNLRSGYVRSCGCLMKEKTREASVVHGLTKTPYYRRWCGIMSRCYNPNRKSYKAYGAKGIYVAEEWKDPVVFCKWAEEVNLGNRQVDRFPDKLGPYAPWNCRPATPKENGANTIRNVELEVAGKTFILAEAFRFFGMAHGITIQKRRKEGWSDEEAVLTPSKVMLKAIEKEYYGLHLTIDLFDCDYDSLSSIDLISKFLDEAPSEVGMTKISQPYVFQHLKPELSEEWGITGVVILSTSHVSAHSYPEQEYISIDLFSCKAFNPYLVLEKSRAVFGGHNASINIVKRGQGFPRIGKDD